MIIDVTPDGLIWARAYAAGACLRGCRRLAVLGTGRVRGQKRGCDGRRREQAARPPAGGGINNGSLEVLDEVADAGFVRVAR
ncbi:MAG TPA: hypothetical protein VJ370_02055 [Streptosporangiaceae bacterium]|nr:hypothetical protein [Streptosporangiaceae bacterium]